jgi:hypothetical protein
MAFASAKNVSLQVRAVSGHNEVLLVAAVLVLLVPTQPTTALLFSRKRHDVSWSYVITRGELRCMPSCAHNTQSNRWSAGEIVQSLPSWVQAASRSALYCCSTAAAKIRLPAVMCCSCHLLLPGCTCANMRVLELLLL